MGNNAFILCVDDEPINLSIMEELLQDSYELNTKDSGQGCLEQVATQRPDLILLDVNMPDLDGLETCRLLKADPNNADIPIIFISALASHSELMAGYEAGGEDYITKPFSEEILRKKIDVVLAGQRRRQELKQISEKAVEDLQDNMSVAEELGVVVRFLTQSQAPVSLDALAHNVFDCLRQMSLDGSLMILSEPENQVWFSDDIDRPMERQILESLHGQDRVVSFGTRLAINADNATLLVRNLPTDEEKVRRLREHLLILIGGLDARLHGLHSNVAGDEERQSLSQVLGNTRDRLVELANLRQQHLTDSGQVQPEYDSQLDGIIEDISRVLQRP